MLYSKKRKYLETVQWYWEWKAQGHATRSDEAPEMDSGSSQDHSCWPQEAQAGTSWSPPKRKKIKVGVLFLLIVKWVIGIVF